MKKLHKLKNWFSLAEAATILGAKWGEPVTGDDVLQFALEGHLTLSLFANDLPARRVAPFTMLHGRGFNPGDDWKYEDNRDFLDGSLITAPEWVRVDDQDTVQHLNGPFHLELARAPGIRKWLRRLINHSTSSQPFNSDGLYLSDPNETIWQVVRRSRLAPRDVITGADSTKQYTSYTGDTLFPSREDLIVQREDIEAFERSLPIEEAIISSDIPPRAETTYLNIIAALLEAGSAGIPDPDKPDAKLGPLVNYKSEAKLIAAIASNFEGINGLSQRNLQNKFALAKRSLSSS